MRTKILFFIHDVGHGGAEKVLVNLINNMDLEKFDISVIALFRGGVNEKFINKNIRFKSIFPIAIPGNSKIMKLFSPKFLHKLFIKDIYDIEVAYLEGPDSRIISGCQHKQTKTVFWIHCTMHSREEFAGSFRNLREAVNCYKQFDAGVFVSKEVKKTFKTYCASINKEEVLYNTNDTDFIIEKSKEKLPLRKEPVFQIIGIGKLDRKSVV